jgi:hypothetical protein
MSSELHTRLLETVPDRRSTSSFHDSAKCLRERGGRDGVDGQLPAEAPPPIAPFKLHAQSLKNLVSAGLDMKNEADRSSLMQPLMDRCGGSIEMLASLIGARLVGGLGDADNTQARRNAFGENRLPAKQLVRNDALNCPL